LNTYGKRLRGKGLGSLLLADVLDRCLTVADIVGGRFIVLDALNEKAALLYARVGFAALPAQQGRMVISMAKVRKNAETAAFHQSGGGSLLDG